MNGSDMNPIGEALRANVEFHDDDALARERVARWTKNLVNRRPEGLVFLAATAGMVLGCLIKRR